MPLQQFPMETFRSVAFYLGLVSLGTLTIKTLSFAYLRLRTFRRPLCRYAHGEQPYALITGASDGIGYGFAQNIAAQGFNLILVACNKEKLEERKGQLLSDYPTIRVEVLVVDAFSESLESTLQSAIQSISHLNLRILINNLGGFGPNGELAEKFSEQSTTAMNEIYNLNCRFLMLTTHWMLPKNQPSLILNTSSGAQVGLPLSVMYSASKAFVRSFTVALSRECTALQQAIDVLSVFVASVNTNMVPTSTGFTRPALARVGPAVSLGHTEIVPHLPHMVFKILLTSLPYGMIAKMIMRAINASKHKVK